MELIKHEYRARVIPLNEITIVTDAQATNLDIEFLRVAPPPDGGTIHRYVMTQAGPIEGSQVFWNLGTLNADTVGNVTLEEFAVSLAVLIQSSINLNLGPGYGVVSVDGTTIDIYFPPGNIPENIGLRTVETVTTAKDYFRFEIPVRFLPFMLAEISVMPVDFEAPDYASYTAAADLAPILIYRKGHNGNMIAMPDVPGILHLVNQRPSVPYRVDWSDFTFPPGVYYVQTYGLTPGSTRFVYGEYLGGRK
jgi:hypothetical protein